MKCVSRTHVGNRGGSKNRDTNKYRRIVPFINVACLECTFAKRGSGGCIIKNPEMAVQFNMQPKEKT